MIPVSAACFEIRSRDVPEASSALEIGDASGDRWQRERGEENVCRSYHPWRKLRNPLRRRCLSLVTSSSHLPRVGMPSLLKRAGAPPGGLRRATDCQNQRGPPTHRWMVRLVRKRRGKVFGGDSLSGFERWWSRQCSSQRRRRAPVRRRRVLDAGEMSGRQRRSGTGRRCRGRTL